MNLLLLHMPMDFFSHVAWKLASDKRNAWIMALFLVFMCQYSTLSIFQCMEPWMTSNLEHECEKAVRMVTHLLKVAVKHQQFDVSDSRV